MKWLKHIPNTFLAIVLLLATTGVTLNKHYCMGRLMSVAVNSHAENCSGSDTTDPMPCCKDVTQQLKIEELTISQFDFDATPDLFELANINWILLTEAEFSLELKEFQLQRYTPPLPERDLPVLFQSFLI